MKTALPNATPEQKERFRIIKEELGCIACWIDHNRYVPCNVHHLLNTGTRRGHSFTIGLCEHEDDNFNHHTGNKMSVHKTKKAFARRYGSDDELLQITNDLIQLHRDCYE